MKILVLSLLRIGDVILSAPALGELRRRHPDSQIHLLINAQFMQVSELLPGIDRVISFDRETLQRGLGDAREPVFISYDRLSDFLDQLAAEEYDWVINLTHNRLSGWLMSLIEGKKKTGLCLDAHGRASFGSSWFRYLNNQVESEGNEVFHYSDVFRFALGARDGEGVGVGISVGEGDARESETRESETRESETREGRACQLQETAIGRREADAILACLPSRNIIAVQPVTSDAKKNWGAERFASVIEKVSCLHQDASFVIICAPNEVGRLSESVALLKSRGVSTELAPLSFAGAFSMVKSARMLLTGDTSVKHLAASASVPIVEVSIGSSDAYRTGAYGEGSVIIRTRETCAPCPHSSACHRASHACAESMPVEAVAMIVGEIYARRSFQLRTIAREYADSIEVLSVAPDAAGHWVAYSVLEVLSTTSIGRWIDLSCRKLWIANSTHDSAVSMPSEVAGLAKLLSSIYPSTSRYEWQPLFIELEKQVVTVAARVNALKGGLQRVCGSGFDVRGQRQNELVRALMVFRQRIRNVGILRSFRVSLDALLEDEVSDLPTKMNRTLEFIVEVESRTRIHVGLIRGLIQLLIQERRVEKS